MGDPTASAPGSEGKAFLRVIDGEARDRPPVWLMRQAGRYLPEYRDIRATTPSFLELCYTPRLAAEVTLQPIRRFGFDAAILFSDILVIPDALGLPVTFEAGHGPRLRPVVTAEDACLLRDTVDMGRLAPILETIERVKAALPAEVALIGFCGAPFTVASYMVAGAGTPDQAPARLLAYRNPALFEGLVDRIVEASVTYLAAQLAAGAEAVQIFDSWAGVLPPLEYERWSLRPIARIVRLLRERRPDARVIGFSRVSGAALLAAAASGASALGLDTAVDARWAADTLPPGLPLQGNLDPLALVAGGGELDRAVEDILAAFAGRPHVFNLGHGILPETPIAHVEALMRRLRAA